MTLWFSPMTSSLATRIALYEAGADATFVRVDLKTKRTTDGADFRAIHALGLVPALEMDGEILTENAAVLQAVADRFPASGLAPADPRGRRRLHQWLSFIGTELHKCTFAPLFDASASDSVRAYALSKARSRLAWVAEQLDGREFLLDRFSVADAYLVVILSWTTAVSVDLTPWPALQTYLARLLERPSVARAFADERERV